MDPSLMDPSDIPDVTTEVEEIDITGFLADTEIQAMFDAADGEDWAAVDRLIDAIDIESAYALMMEGKEGGADRNRGGADKLRRYWTVGEGAAKIRWGQEGDWTRCVEHLTKYLGARAKGYCALRHKEMDGFYPGDKRNKAASQGVMEDTSLYHGSKQDDAANDLGEPMTIEHKTVGVKGLNVVDAAQGIVETVISVTGVVDNVKDRIMPGAYTKTLATRTPKGVWSHDWNEPVSKTLSVKELMPGDSELPKTMPNGAGWPAAAGALKVKTQFNLETQRGREAFSDVVFFGEEQEWSIGYQVPVGGAKVDPQSGVREINFLELYEYSPVLFGAMPLARTTSVKDAQYAYKALMEGGAASWVADAEVIDMTDDGPQEYEDYDFEDVDGKSMLDGDQMILVKTAIQTLTDLLDAVEAEYKGGKPPVDDEEADPNEAEPDADEDDGGEYGSLAEAVDDIAGDLDCADDLNTAAEGIDNAVRNDDSAALEAASTAFLDTIEQNLGNEDDDALQELAQILGDMIEQISTMSSSPDDGDGTDEEAPVEDMEGKEAMCETCGKPMSECECDNPGKPESSTLLNADEIKSALAAFEM